MMQVSQARLIHILVFLMIRIIMVNVMKTRALSAVRLILIPPPPLSPTLHVTISNSVSPMIFHILFEHFGRRPIGGKPLLGHVGMCLACLPDSQSKLLIYLYR